MSALKFVSLQDSLKVSPGNTLLMFLIIPHPALVTYCELKAPIRHSLLHLVLRISTHPKQPHPFPLELLVELVKLLEVPLNYDVIGRCKQS